MTTQPTLKSMSYLAFLEAISRYIKNLRHRTVKNRTVILSGDYIHGIVRN
jgi:hypothetical protein